MKQILKNLFKYKYYILLIIVLLIFQALCDLSLPEYTSNIVNVGIQNSGIENTVPEVIRESEYNKIKSYLSINEQKRLDTYYKYIEKNDSKYINTYKILDSEGVYVLNTKEDIQEFLLMPLAINYYASLDSTMKASVDIKNMEANKSLIKSALFNYIKSEYKIVGLDTNKIQMNYIYKTGLYMILIAIIACILTIISTYLSSRVAASFSKDLRNDLVKKCMDLEVVDLKKYSTATLITRCTNDVLQLQGLVMAFLRIIVFAPIIGIGAIVKVNSSPLSWVIIVSVIAIFILLLILFIVVVPKFKKFQELLDRLNLVSREILTGLPVIRAFANEKIEEERFDVANSNLTKNGLFVNRSMSLLIPTLTFIMNSVAILIIYAGSKEVNNFNMQVGDLIAFITYTMQIIMSFLMLSMVAIMLPRAIVSIKRISEVFNTHKSITDKQNTKKLNKIETIDFRDVYFRYPDALEDVLSNINFNAKKGETVAFIGSTGSGKSTLINLIPRFFDITAGKILINNIDIKDISIKNLRDKIGYVSQKGKLFKGTIMYNLTFGQDKKDIEMAKTAAKMSQVMEFVDESDEGFDKVISEGATNVSGGQKQRLSIARALAKDSDIYIFDDSFSALDFKTDSLIRKELNKIKKDKIIFVVAQRISSIMNADKIVVLNEGKIEAVGTHEELLKISKTYKEINDSQLGSDRI